MILALQDTLPTDFWFTASQVGFALFATIGGWVLRSAMAQVNRLSATVTEMEKDLRARQYTADIHIARLDERISYQEKKA